uniref:NADH-ubiquinone oxidoreductase chain 6 n=4 Tax=Parabotia TaxID=143404 RepID=A0A0U1XYC2_9TELE|nr:NADH dehydrogenase subunit 6 [Parabotia fasciatus]YP_010004078.1 NADH dehydrogenase subunit 6 [Parabotia kiangsiensis]YP_010352204.1 NADH dehydrogenase subunit 6 [Parabotia lijiangensis]YP_913716.1 NADH dehydrogenase subunit 6 [Leptobotia mantschurica]AJA05862.1 NADH dehydrogenase subunit 6 [Parabotia fasciatus]QJQ34874.1 NADH dehydrogenase subunit 6 [Parabotia lijiangensis]QNR01158.1 NADH dehydrogenase subunit 6 [Parabotia kiangsiensis]UOL50250.1 NADH dehydrogenase subunit 6 [Parabotia l
MTYLVSLLLIALIVGLVAVASNPAPYFAALGLVVAAGVGCGVLIGHGGSFLSLVLFLIYLGGMLVVFAYSAALAAEPFPEAWGDRSVVGYVLVYLLGVGLMVGLFWENWYEGSWGVVDNLKEFSMLRGDTSGVAMMYSSGGGMLVICAWVLLLTLFVVLELTRGLSRGALRAV